MDNVFKKYYRVMKYYLILIVLIIPICTIRTNYSITTPGGVTKVDQRFSVEDGYESDSFYSLYVYSSENTTIFQNFIAKRFAMFEISEINDKFDHMNDSMWNLAGLIQKNQSLETSMITAYEYASINNSSISIDYNYLGVIVRLTTKENNVFNLGDIITHVNNTKLVSMNQFYDNTREDYIKIKINDVITLIRDEEVVNITIKENDNIGSWFYDKFEILSSSPKCNITPTNSSGPSAGMMQTLSIYNQLTIDNISVKDGVKRTIAGTGTIETDASVGAIGGVMQKVHSAFEAGVDILIMSKENEEEAKEVFNSLKNNNTMQLVIVSNFDEVIKCLS